MPNLILPVLKKLLKATSLIRKRQKRSVGCSSGLVIIAEIIFEIKTKTGLLNNLQNFNFT